MRSEFAGAYGDLERWHWWFLGRQAILEALLERALGDGPPVPRQIVSVGCGPPAGIEWLRRFAGPGGLLVGLDADPSGELRRATTADASATLLLGRLEAPPLRPRSCDLVVALDVLEHLEDDVAGAEQAFSLVREGGWLLVTVPALPSLWGSQDLVSHHYRRYTSRSLLSLLSRADIRNVRTSYFNTLLLPPVAALRLGRRIFGRVRSDRSDFDGARPGWCNALLMRLFALERHALGRVPLPLGVSLVALCRR